MVTFVGVFCSDATLLLCALSRLSDSLERHLASTEGSFGLGYFSGDDVLLVRRPSYQSGSLESLLSRAVCNHFIIAVEKNPPAAFKIESTPPFRYRNFLGVFSAFPQLPEAFANKVMPELPAFLQKDIKSRNGTELLFYLFLSCLYDMGRLQSHRLRIHFIMEALRTTFRLTQMFLEGEQPFEVCACVTNGEHMVAGTQGFPLQMLTLNGVDSCPRCSNQRKTQWMDERRVSHPHCSVVSFANTEETLHGYTRVRDREIVGVDPQGGIVSMEL